MTAAEQIGGFDPYTVAAFAIKHLELASNILRCNAADFRRIDMHAEAAQCEQEAKRLMEPVYIIRRRSPGLMEDLKVMG